MNRDSEILDMKLEYLRSEVLEYKIYLEVCAITLFFVIITFLGTTAGIKQISEGSVLGYVILTTAIILFIAIVYMFYRIVYISKTSMKQVEFDKKMILQEWLK